MREPRTVVLRLVGGKDEGAWLRVTDTPFAAHALSGTTVKRIELVPTGSIEWDGDVPAEVYVPSDKLNLWRAEHAC